MRRNYIEAVLLIALGSYWCIFFLIKFDFLLSEYFDAFFWFQANLTEVEINIDPKHHRHFFSRRNEVTNKISLECGGVEIVFPRATSKSSLVVLKGSKQCVETAKSRIEAILADLVFQILSIYWNCSSLVSVEFLLFILSFKFIRVLCWWTAGSLPFCHCVSFRWQINSFTGFVTKFICVF